MDQKECCVCGDQTLATSTGKQILTHTQDCVEVLMKSFGIISAINSEVIDAVCQLCFGLVQKIDKASFELNSYVDDLKKRVKPGELTILSYSSQIQELKFF